MTKTTAEIERYYGVLFSMSSRVIQWN